MTGHAVLIVDDSLTVRMDLADSFEAAGFRAVTCGTVAEARASLAREPFAVAILDVILPDGDGFDLLETLRALPSPPAVLMLSSETEVKDRIRGLQTGADEYVGKPYDTGYVIARAGELIRRGEAATNGKRTILVVDDSPTFRDALRRGLERDGYAVAEAASGEEGLRLAATHRPDAFIVDGVMPGIDGATVIRRVRLDAALRGVPCLLLTAAEDHGAELRALDAGADAFVRKDGDLDVLLARLGAVLRRATEPRDPSASLLAPKRILAVDDSPTYLEELAAALRVEGYDIVLARSGEEAIELLAVQPVDCIVLDLLMPGLSGQETCLRIKASPVAREIPLIMITALEDRDAMIQGLGAGADDYIAKSSDFDVVRARVRAQLRRKQFEDEHRRVREALLRSELEAAEARTAQQIAEAKAALVEELELRNRELDAFSYSVSHDLRAPLRAIGGFSRILVADHACALDAQARGHLDRICRNVDHMGSLIEDMLQLAQLSRAPLNVSRVDLGALAGAVISDLRAATPERAIQVELGDDLVAFGDPRLLRIVLVNLVGNAWKFTSRVEEARIVIGRADGDDPTFFVRDNGAGFDPTHAARLFAPFGRLHSSTDFEGTGIGLATVRRVIARHGGRVWAEGAVGEGATFWFSVPSIRA